LTPPGRGAAIRVSGRRDHAAIVPASSIREVLAFWVGRLLAHYAIVSKIMENERAVASLSQKSTAKPAVAVHHAPDLDEV
jgi:hypothetical protein